MIPAKARDALNRLADEALEKAEAAEGADRDEELAAAGIIYAGLSLVDALDRIADALNPS